MEGIGKNWLKFFQTLNESQKRWPSGPLASEIGYGGVETVSTATNVSKTTIDHNENNAKILAKKVCSFRTPIYSKYLPFVF